MAVSCIIYEIKRDIRRKYRFFPIPAFDAPVRGSNRNTATPFGLEKLEWCGYPKMKTFVDMFSHVARIPAVDRQTDGHLARA